MYPRYLKNRMLDFIKHSPVTLLLGGRQTGKTTFVKKLMKECSYQYISLDDLRYLSSAKDDPIAFLNQFKGPVIIDEIQRAPQLALPIKQKVDENREPGLFILTGSSNPLKSSKLSDSLAGRMFILNLYPLSQSELYSQNSSFLQSCFHSEFKNQYEKTQKDTWLEKLLVGGFPTVQSLPFDMKEEWMNAHLRILLERDIQELTQLRKLGELPLLMKLLAARSASLLNLSEISRSSGIAYATLTEYFALLEALFLIERVPAFHKNRTKRLVKSPKLFLADTGMMSFLLGVGKERLIQDSSLLGHFFETFVFLEIQKLISFSKERISIYHYRTTVGMEVDLILENPAGQFIAVEIKSSETVQASDFKHLKALKEEFQGEMLKGIVIYPGHETISFGKEFFAVPLSSLWS